jgi:hypothetical protein
VVPLGLYLASFVVAFWPRLGYPRRLLVPLGAILIAVALGWPGLGRNALSVGLGVPLALLFVGCWICHAELARDRPAPEQVTEYYLWIAVGGFVGGVFGNLVAPLLFRSITEYPLSLALVAVLISVGDGGGTALVAALRRPATWMRLLSTAALFTVWAVVARQATDPPTDWHLVPFALLMISLALMRLPGQFAAACACAALVNSLGVFPGVRTVETRRSFFGVVRVREADGKRRLVHGTTWHGAQWIAPFDPSPLLYYSPFSPLSRAVTLQRPDAHLAVVGLGTGSVAYYSKPGQTLHFYEIDPIIEPMARRWFTFLGDAKARVDVELGDARLTLGAAPDRSIDFLLVDAFSSDAIPVHLLTVEALRLYFAKLKPDGLIVLHVSNRHLDLVPVLRANARQLGVSAAQIRYTPDAETTVQAVALARTAAPLEELLARGWSEMGAGREVPWSDDRSNLLSVIAE